MIRTNGEFTSNSTVLQGLKVASITEDNKEWSPLPRTLSDQIFQLTMMKL